MSTPNSKVRGALLNHGLIFIEASLTLLTVLFLVLVDEPVTASVQKTRRVYIKSDFWFFVAAATHSSLG